MEGLEASVRNALHDSADEWASAEYRMDVAATLAKRCRVINMITDAQIVSQITKSGHDSKP
jgi:hypothetical protein